LIYANLNEPETAFRWLDKALEERGYWTLWMRVEPRFDRLAQRSAFRRTLLGKIKPLSDSKVTADFGSPPTSEMRAAHSLNFKRAAAAAMAAADSDRFVFSALLYISSAFGSSKQPNRR
jgi:hypothetical protein